jgi:hypothetical protein
VRDLKHLEELSSATAFGSWAYDVVLALDRVDSGTDPMPSDRAVLVQAAELLSALADPASRPKTADSARSVATSETTRSAVATVLGAGSVEDLKPILDELASAAREAAEGRSPDAERLQRLIALFDRVGDLQLVRSNDVLAARKDAVTWTAMRMT